MSLLTIIQNVTRELGLPKPTTVVGNDDATVVQLLALANRSGKEIAKGRGGEILSEMRREVSHTTVATELQGTMASIAGADFDYVVNETMWDRTSQQKIVNIGTAQKWQRLQAQTVSSPFYQYRIRVNSSTMEKSLYFYPAPSAGNSVYFEYKSKYWCRNSTTGKSSFTSDTDVGIIPEDLIELELIWRYKEKNGLDYAEDFRVAQDAFEYHLGSTDGAPTLDAAGCDEDRVTVNIPEGNWS